MVARTVIIFSADDGMSDRALRLVVRDRQPGVSQEERESLPAFCDKDVKELQAIQYYSMTDVSALNEVATKYESFVSRYREQSVKFYAKDIPNFISNHIGSKCSQLKSNSANYKAEENQEVVKACENVSSLKRKGVELFRAEGTADYDRLAEQFVRENNCQN